MNENDAPHVVFAVVFSNYEPAEIDSLWRTQPRAQERADELNRRSPKDSAWRVAQWPVES